MKNTFLLLNNVINLLDLFKILTCYIDAKKILEIRNKNINIDTIFSQFSRVHCILILVKKTIKNRFLLKESDSARTVA